MQAIQTYSEEWMSTIPVLALKHILPTPRYGQYPSYAKRYHPGILEVTHSLFQTTCPPPSAETQGQSVGPGEKARLKFSSTGGRAPGYRLSPDHCSKWSSECWLLIGHKNCFVLYLVPNRRTTSPGFFQFREFVHDGYLLDYGLSGNARSQET